MKATWTIPLSAAILVLGVFGMSVLAGASAVFAEQPNKPQIVEAR